MPIIPPNLGVERQYSRALVSLVREIQEGIQAELIQEFRRLAKVEKSNLAMDGITDWVGHVVDYLSSKWLHKLDDLAPQIARAFIHNTSSNFDMVMKRHMRKAGFTVRFQMVDTNEVRAVFAENVRLIKSIGQQYLGNVETHVWQCVQSGYDLSELSKNLQNDFGVSKRRAQFIARDQAAKAHAEIERARREELGITKAVWQHSHAGKEPRPSHVAANGKEFDVSKGMYLDGKWVLPGQEINCRCTSRAVIEGIA
ncbi:hypothetical protein AAEX37_01965 [Oligella sp. MSHR50489EDL]